MRDRALEVLADDLRRLLERGKRRQLTALERLEVQRCGLAIEALQAMELVADG